MLSIQNKLARVFFLIVATILVQLVDNTSCGAGLLETVDQQNQNLELAAHPLRSADQVHTQAQEHALMQTELPVEVRKSWLSNIWRKTTNWLSKHKWEIAMVTGLAVDTAVDYVMSYCLDAALDIAVSPFGNSSVIQGCASLYRTLDEFGILEEVTNETGQ